MSIPINKISSSADRIRFLDALRGVAVLFIYVANIGYFSGMFFFPEEAHYDWATLPTDFALDISLYTLIDGKFYTIFSLLFGIGCAIQYQRLDRFNKPFKPFFRRRMFWLLVIGLIHLCLIWLGDILTLYALLGFLLPFFIRFSDRRLLQWAVVLILLPILNDVLIKFIGFEYPAFFAALNETLAAKLGVPNLRNMPAQFLTQDFAAFFKTNLSNVFIRILRILDEGREFKVLGIFLIGLWAGRKIMTENLLYNTKLLKKIVLWGICIGLPMSMFRSYIEFFKQGDMWGFLRTITYALGTVPLALSYASLLALQYRKKSAFMIIFEPVGRMALTNYIMQTFISIALFYGIGFGLAGKFGCTVILGIALSVFLFQIIFSSIWLSAFKQGPIEWFWRRATSNRESNDEFPIHQR